MARCATPVNAALTDRHTGGAVATAIRWPERLDSDPADDLGRVKLNLLPAPPTLSTQIRPPWAWTIPMTEPQAVISSHDREEFRRLTIMLLETGPESPDWDVVSCVVKPREQNQGP